MSGFDVQMRSQAMVNQSQQFYDAQRYQSMDAMGQSLMQAPGMIQEIAIRGQDARMRLAQQQQEFQSNQVKLQAMMAIDQADASREQSRALKLQNDSMEQEMMLRMRSQQQQEKAGSEDWVSDRIRAYGGIDRMNESGLGYDEKKKQFQTLDEDQMKQVQTRSQQRLLTARDSEDRLRFQAEHKALMEQGRIEEAEEALTRFLSAREGAGGGVGRAAAGSAPQPPMAPTPAQQAKIEGLTRNVYSALTQKSDRHPGLNREAAPHVASWMDKNSAVLLEQTKRAAAAAGWSKSDIDALTVDTAIQRYVTVLSQHGSREQQALIQYLAQAGAFAAMDGQK